MIERDNNRRHYLRMFGRVIRLLIFQPTNISPFVQDSYDHISGGYDDVWTGHMRDLTEKLIEKLDPQEGQTTVDLTCGTGYATHLVAQRTRTRVTGVDASAGMLAQARANYGGACEFVQADVLEYLKDQPAGSLDIVTCCWGLGYSRPWAVLRQIKRVLKPAGKVAIIDNTLFSLKEVLYCSFLAFAERPGALKNLMRFRFLTGLRLLRFYFRMLGMRSLYSDGGSRSYTVESGRAAIKRLIVTGAAAGFEYAADEKDRKQVFDRFAEILEQKYKDENRIPITHRYLAGIGQK